jgi:DNA-binding SARP family transcriptional activator
MFRLRTLGSASVDGDAPLAGRSSGRRRLALLALLAVARERGISRDKVLAYLWPERDSGHARHALSQILYSLRGELGPDAVIAGVDDLRLNPAVIASDVAEFEEAVERGDHARATKLYAGPFLDGFFISDAPEFEQWAEIERQRLAQTCARALECAAEDASRGGDDRAAVEIWRRRAALDPLNSRVALRLMTALAAAGDAAGAVQHARVHAMLRQQELDAPADAAVAELAEHLRCAPAAVAIAEPSERRASFVPVGPASDPLPAPTAVASLPEPLSAPASVGSAARRPFHRPVTAAAALLAVAALLAAGVVFAHHDGSPPPLVRRAIVIGTIRSPDSTLGLAVREALRAELESERGLRVLGESEIREALELMRISGDTTISAPVAVEIAQRRGVPLAIVGSAAPLGTGAQLVAQLLDARTGAPIATVTERPGTAKDVVPAVTRLAASLRRHVVGTVVDSAPQPLPAVTTSSLAALRNYAVARQAITRLDRQGAIALLEVALAHDSLFVLAHYLLGDLLWYVDQQSHSDVHLNAALRLSNRLPPRERLIVRARHEQLVRDRLDSALAYWQQLRASYPDEPLVYDGLIWIYIALVRPADIAAAAQTAQLLNPTSPFYVRMRYVSALEMGDTAGALRIARSARGVMPNAEVNVRLEMADRGEWDGGLRLIDSAYPPLPDGRPNVTAAPDRQLLLLGLGRLDEAWREMETVVETNAAQGPHRAMLFQAHAEIGSRGPTDRAKMLVRRAFALTAGSDLYPPAIARLTELAVTAAARLGDTATVSAARRLILSRDAGRNLHSYRVALLTIDASAAFARGDMRLAADLAARSRREVFHGRAFGDVALLEGDARRALGDRAGARSVYQDASRLRSPWRTLAKRALARH